MIPIDYPIWTCREVPTIFSLRQLAKPLILLGLLTAVACSTTDGSSPSQPGLATTTAQEKPDTSQQVITNEAKELNFTINDFPVGWQIADQGESNGGYQIRALKLGKFIALPEEIVSSWVRVFPDLDAAKEDYEVRRKGHEDRFRLDDLEFGDSSYIYEGNATDEVIFRVKNVIVQVTMFTQYGGSLKDVERWADQLSDKIGKLQKLEEPVRSVNPTASTGLSNETPALSSTSTSAPASISSNPEPTVDIERMIEAEVQRRLDALATPVPGTVDPDPMPTQVPTIIPKTENQINPAESTHRTVVSWSATGFSSDSPVIVTYGSERNRVATVISDGSGRASGTFQVPLGSYTSSSNIVEITDNSGNTVSLLHTIPNPSISVSSFTAPAGSTVMITGHHFPPIRALSSVTIGGIGVTPKPRAPQTNNQGELEIEIWIPQQLKGLESLKVEILDDNFIVSAETTLEVTRRLPLELALDSYQGIRNSTVKWETSNGTANSSLKILYGSQRTTVATSTSNEFGQASGELAVPADAPIPSENLVSAVEVTGSSSSTPHSVPAAIIDMEWSRVTAGSSIMLVGKYFPQSESIDVAKIGDISVLPNPNPVTDLDGNFQLNVLVPHQTPGEKSVMVQIGTGPSAVSARTDLMVEPADPIPVGWNEVSLNGERWEETGRSKECPEGLCLRASKIPNNSYAEMNLILLHKSSSRFSPYMERTTVSFEIKTSTESCCDILRVEHDGSTFGSWSGNTDWQQVQFELSSARPTMIQWIYQKDDGTTSGDDSVWVRNIQMK